MDVARRKVAGRKATEAEVRLSALTARKVELENYVLSKQREVNEIDRKVASKDRLDASILQLSTDKANLQTGIGVAKSEIAALHKRANALSREVEDAELVQSVKARRHLVEEAMRHERLMASIAPLEKKIIGLGATIAKLEAKRTRSVSTVGLANANLAKVRDDYEKTRAALSEEIAAAEKAMAIMHEERKRLDIYRHRMEGWAINLDVILPK